ncbi:hypothetical protein L1049_009545 [Liquidambar formosana]|uniref:DUF4220 domain-containing protein n=1 Tax=Liquidambar formosana TaxID=63359 RepID=A0AAP0N873_LIQFO
MRFSTPRLPWCIVRKDTLSAFFLFFSVVGALALFYFDEKHGFHKFDVRITHTLLLGAIALDIIALLMLIFSDRTVAFIDKSKKNSFPANILNIVLIFKRAWGNEDSKNPRTKFKRHLFRRWSESVKTYNLIDYCLKECPERIDTIPDCLGLKYFRYEIKKMFGKFTAYLGVKDFLDYLKYVESQPFTPELRNFIFDELKKKSEIADDSETAKEICSARGDWVLRDHGSPWTKLLKWTDDVDYDESLLLWHIATELCLNTNDGDTAEKRRKFCETLSNYMLYLLVMQPTMMSAVAGIGQIRFRDTCAEAKKFFSRGEWDQKEACKKVLEVNTDVKPVDVKGDRSKSVLFDACMLAKELEELKKQDMSVNKWDVMSEVWVELLSYAASHCRANTDAQLLSKGGELITFVWLLMAHFGIGEQFQIKEGHARAKLIVGK